MFRHTYIWMHLCLGSVWMNACSWAKQLPFSIQMIYLPFTNRKSVRRKKKTRRTRMKAKTNCEAAHRHATRPMDNITGGYHEYKGSGRPSSRPKREEKYVRYNFAQATIFRSAEICTRSKQWKMLLVCGARLLPIRSWDTWELCNRTLCFDLLYVCDFDVSVFSSERLTHKRTRMHNTPFRTALHPFRIHLRVFGQRFSELIDMYDVYIRMPCTYSRK